MLDTILSGNEFYRRKFAAVDVRRVESLSDLRVLPFTTKGELVTDQQRHPFGTGLTYPQERYIRIHQTYASTVECKRNSEVN